MPWLESDVKARLEFLDLIELEHRLLAPAPQFRLSTYEAQARARAGERGAGAFRRMVTTWTSRRFGTTSLTDYANREYSELLGGYYLPRWRRFLLR